MGEIAEDIIDGACCDLCGMYFENPDEPGNLASHGHPATCDDCWDELSQKQKKHHTKSMYMTL